MFDVGDNVTQIALAIVALFSSVAGYISGYCMGKRKNNNTTVKK